MTILIDIGNSNIKSAVLSGEKLTGFEMHRSIDGFISNLKDLKLSTAVVTSVNKEKYGEVSEYLNSRKMKLQLVSYKTDFSFELKYDTPETLGTDRLCSLEGARFILSKAFKNRDLNSLPLVTVDLGTATTVNIINNKNEFIGGMIAPGIKTMAESLNTGTSMLPNINPEQYRNIIGTDTNTSIAAGIINATRGLVDFAYGYVRDKFGIPPKLFLTGGNADIITPYLSLEYEHVKPLVLNGLASICLRNNLHR